MKFSYLALAALFVFNLSAGACGDTFKSAPSKKFECQSTGSESSIITIEGRIIFVAKTACLEINSDNVHIHFLHPEIGPYDLKIKQSSEKTISAEKSDRVYPSGNVAKSYLIVDSFNLTDLNSDMPKFNFKSAEKHVFRKDELRYVGQYSCELIK
jgi:hypothetical protein